MAKLKDDDQRVGAYSDEIKRLERVVAIDSAKTAKDWELIHGDEIRVNEALARMDAARGVLGQSRFEAAKNAVTEASREQDKHLDKLRTDMDTERLDQAEQSNVLDLDDLKKQQADADRSKVRADMERVTSAFLPPAQP